MRPTATNYIVLIIVLIPYVLCANQSPASAVDDDTLRAARELVNNFLNNTANGFAPGLVIGVSVKGEQKWVEGFGLANVENNVAMTKDAVMQIGSIGKSFTFALASRLMYEGKLNFDVSIREYLSHEEFPDRMWNGTVANITLRHIFQMTSGFPEGPSDSDIGFCLRCENSTGRMVFLRDRFQDLDFEPGTNFTYANFGTELAGAIIEKILENRTFSVAYMDMVRNVLKLNHTAIINTTLITPNLASFYTTDMEHLYNSGMWGDIFVNDFPAAGGVTSTISDVLTYGQIWLDAYYGRSEHFVKQSTVKEAWIPTDVSRDILPYGLAWIIYNVTGNRPSGNQLVWHSGGTLGCRSMLAIYPESEIIVAASVNLAESPIDEFIIEGSIADLFANATQVQQV
ncbi:serine beta-lactamase-like protein LACTB, mitochondrial [Bradysia coprophila]|uniref:serine beta-lactamase-like protein LACTB, mitochondrial n=1 Tax=Bradysia coprophila TaxID=38358 RepID=UPI00187D82DE|nr:serine beta-lactamase-like protein LACTB, mitochondrial [Bradysia coprophila]